MDSVIYVVNVYVPVWDLGEEALLLQEFNLLTKSKAWLIVIVALPHQSPDASGEMSQKAGRQTHGESEPLSAALNLFDPRPQLEILQILSQPMSDMTYIPVCMQIVSTFIVFNQMQ